MSRPPSTSLAVLPQQAATQRDGASYGIRCALLLSLVIATVGGCNGDDASPTQGTSAVTRTKTEGLVTITLSVNPPTVNIDQLTTVTAKLEAPAGVTAYMDDYVGILRSDEASFERQLTPLSKLSAVPTENGTLTWTQTVQVEHLLAGDYEFPGATASFTSEAEDGSVTETTLETEAITFAVTDASASQPTEEELATITVLDPVELPKPWSWHLRWAVPCIGLAILIVLILWARRRRKDREEVIPVIPAHEWARAEMARLLARDLIEQGLIQSFYYGISDVVRGYVERRFEVRAPEMTTPEFLSTVAEDSRFRRDHADELNTFLTACDLVKYARHEPDSAQAQELIRSATDYVETTRVRAGEEQHAQPTSNTNGKSQP